MGGVPNGWRVLAYAFWLCAMAVFVFSSSARAEEPLVSSAPWVSDASLTGFFPTEGTAFLLPIVSVEKKGFRLEGRYNYEDLHTGSVFAGITGSAGSALAVDAAVLVGGVFGETNGLAPALELAFRWRNWELTSECEYLFDSNDKNANFFYNWSELSFSLVERLRMGLVGQRTKSYQTENDFERGLLFGGHGNTFYFTAYVFNIGFGSVYPAFTAGASF